MTRDEGERVVVMVECNARGLPVGDSHHFTRWQRSVVDAALAMRAAGGTYRAMCGELGVPLATLHSWISGRHRKTPAKVVVRVKQRNSFGVNHQRTMPENVVQPEKQGLADEDAAVLSSPLPPSLPTPEID